MNFCGLSWAARVGLAAALSLPAVEQVCATPVRAADEQTSALVHAYNASGQELFRRLAWGPGNIVLSPYSIGTAMAMALSGARGDTASEMARVLMQSMPSASIDAANADVMAALKGYDRSAEPPTCPPGASAHAGRCVAKPIGDRKSCPYGMTLGEGNRCAGSGTPEPSAKLLSANALVLLKQGGLISESYAATLRNKYTAEVFRDASLDDINAWVDRKTEGMVPRVLDRIEPNLAAVLLNAIYFKARWESVFDKKRTDDENFDLSRSRKVRVAMMNLTRSSAVVSREGFRAIRLPYAVAKLGMIVVLPNEVEGVDAVARRLGEDELDDLVGALRGAQARRPVALALPRFKAEHRADLVPAFREAGMEQAFDWRKADFSGMTGMPPQDGGVFISGIVHRAVLEVAEESTEAAAVTAIEIASLAAPIRQPEPFRVDRPFLFYLVDDGTGAILFQGRIVDPR
jgi:serpin B